MFGGTMNLTRAICLFLSLFIYQQSFAQSYTDLGKRLPSCINAQTDDFEARVKSPLSPEAKHLFTNDKLTQIIVVDPHCFRVGTEIKVFLENETYGYLGRAFISSMEILNSSKLKRKKLIYSKNSIQNFIKQNQSPQYTLLNIKVSEKVTETMVNKKYERLPTCFPTYGDWKTYRLPTENGEVVARKIQTRKKVAHITSGTFNCYKIDVPATLVIPKTKTKDLGSVIPKELHLIHYTNVTKEHAALLGESFAAVKKRLEEKKQIDGGYTTLVVFEYLEPRIEEDSSTEKL